MPLLELLDPIFQESPLVLRRLGLRRNGLDVGFGHLIYGDGGEDLLQTADDVALNDLDGYIRNEDVPGNLQRFGI